MEGRSSREAMEGSRTAAVDVEALTLETGGREGAVHRSPRTSNTTAMIVASSAMEPGGAGLLDAEPAG
jgi:hypothetical protein